MPTRNFAGFESLLSPIWHDAFSQPRSQGLSLPPAPEDRKGLEEEITWEQGCSFLRKEQI